jgi:hypothetical protein
VNSGYAGGDISPNVNTGNWSTSGILYAPMVIKANSYLANQGVSKFSLIKITCGINDAIGETELATIEADIASLITRLHTDFPETPIMINNIEDRDAVQDRVDAIRGYLAAIIAADDLVYAGKDLFEFTSGYFFDGLHLRQNGNDLMGTHDAYAYLTLAALSCASYNTIETISDKFMWLPLNIAYTNADPVTVAYDRLRAYNMINQGTLNRSVQNEKECIYIDGSNYLKTSFYNFSELFRATFSVSLQVKLADGNPAATRYFINYANSTVSRFLIDLRTDGKITVTYTASSTSIYAQTAAAVFADGEAADFAHIVVVVPSGGTIEIWVNGSKKTLSGTYPGVMGALDMSTFDAPAAAFYVGSGTTAAVGYYRNVIIQNVAYNEANITALAEL